MTMLEKLARALYLDLYPHDLQFEDWEVMESSYTQSARAALESLREPTPYMLDKGAWVLVSNGDLTPSAEARAVWAAMIDAALGDKSKGLP